MTATRFHMCMDIRGALRSRVHERGAFQHPDGRPMTSNEAFDCLCDLLAKGHRVMPLSDDCEGFDPQTGCPGHPVPDTDEGKCLARAVDTDRPLDRCEDYPRCPCGGPENFAGTAGAETAP